ncbi:MAG: MFS transporter [Dehalococcoidia bacterium]
MDKPDNVDNGGTGHRGTDTGAGRQGLSLRSLRTFDSLKNPAFRLYFGNMLGYMAGMNMEMTARNWLIYELTRSPTILGLKSLAVAGPMLFFSLFGGVIANRVQKNRVLFVGQMLSAVISVSIAIALATGYLSGERAGSWWILIVAAAFQGTVSSLMMPSRHVMLYEIVGGRQLLNAVSLNTLAMNGMRVLGPALAGLVIESFEVTTAYYVITGLYLTSSLVIPFLPRTKPTGLGGQGAISEIKEGINYVRKDTTILLVLVYALIAIILATPYWTLIPIVAVEVLEVGAGGLAMMMSSIGIGAIAGSLILASLPDRRRGLLLILSAIGFAMALIGFAFSSSWYLSLALLVVAGLGQSGLIAVTTTVLQDYSLDEYRARVMSIFGMEVGLIGFGGFGAALLSEVIPVQWVIGGFAMVLVFLSVVTLALVPRLRNLN